MREESSSEKALEFYNDSAVLRTIVSKFPIVGNFIDISVTNKWNNIQHNRIFGLLNRLSVDLQDVEERMIDKEYLKSEQFYDIIAKILNDIIHNRSEPKEHAYARILKNVMINPESFPEMDLLSDIFNFFRARDVDFIMAIKKHIESHDSPFMAADIQSLVPSNNFFDEDPQKTIEREFYRLSNVGILDYPRNTIAKSQKFSTTPLFDVVMSYLSD